MFKFKQVSVGLSALLMTTMSNFFYFSQPAIADPKGFYVCNETGEKISVAIAYYQGNDRWTTKGWWTLPYKECSKIHTSLNNTRFYLYASSWESNKEWQADHPFCVSANSFTIQDASRTYCQEVENFFSVWVVGPDYKFPESYTYTFTPDNSNLNHPRAER